MPSHSHDRGNPQYEVEYTFLKIRRQKCAGIHLFSICDIRYTSGLNSDECSRLGQRCVVHRSKWGLGYYLAESAREGDLITGATCSIILHHLLGFNVH